MRTPVRIAILASGAGTNADQICAHFAESESADVALIITNNKEAGVLNVAERHCVPSLVIANDRLSVDLLDELEKHNINFVVLAGFLRAVPKNVVAAFEHRMVNIHPALLPKFGGKGMYGMHVHRAVIDQGEVESGITIHYVNEHYDEGDVIFQTTCEVKPSDRPEDLAKRIHKLEHEHFARIIGKLIAESF